MPSAKSAVIEHLFVQKTAAGSGYRVTMSEVQAAIVTTRAALNPDSNRANFFKDFVRSAKSANANWPAKVFAAGYTGCQRTGGGACFEFVPIKPGQSVPFPPLRIPSNRKTCPHREVQTLTLPVAARKLGRKEETWLLQVVVAIDLVQVHFAASGSSKYEYVQHLQTGVKQRSAEMDALYLGLDSSGKSFLIVVEAKGERDDLLESQLLAQLDAVGSMKSLAAMKLSGVTSVGIKVVSATGKGKARAKKSTLYVAEFDTISFGSAAPAALTLRSEGLYDLVPAVPGIGI